MSAEVAQNGGSDSGRNWYLWLVKVAVVGALVVGVITVVAWYAIRTPVVLGELLGPEIAQQAIDHDVQLEIGAMGPAGFTGVRLYEVDAQIERGGYALGWSVDRVDVVPAIGESISQRRPVLSSVEMGAVQLTVDDADVPELEEPDEPDEPDEAHAGDEPVADAVDPAGVERFLSEQVDISVEQFSADVGQRRGVARFEQLRFGVDGQTLWPMDLNAWGEVGTLPVHLEADNDALFVRVGDDEFEQIVDALPADVQLDAVSVGHEQIERFVTTGDIASLAPRIHGLGVVAPDGHTELKVDESTLIADASSAVWSAGEAQLNIGGESMSLENTELAMRGDTPGVGYTTRVVDGQGGEIQVQGSWHLDTSLVEVNAWFQNFRWEGAMPLPLVEESPVEQVYVDGAVHGDVDLMHQVVSLDGKLQLGELTVDAPLVADEPVTFERMELGVPTTVDISAAAISVVGGTVAIEDLHPFELSGRVVDAGDNTWVFDLDAGATDIDVARLIDRLPPQLTGVAREATLDGLFGVQLRLRGHTAYPESLRLEVDLRGDDVEVIEDIRWSEHGGDDVLLFDTDSPDRFSVQGQWVELEELPAHITASVLAAEDAAFFEHDGVDWEGVEMALEQNIEEGGLVRGGSTITQQVAKNLFLTHDRTIARKVQEAFLTWRLEQSLTKEEILQLYLNVAEWGPEVKGVYAAAHYFFDVDPTELEEVEMVMLASILPGPIRFGGAIKQDYLPSSREDKMRRVLENMRFVDDLSWEQYHAAVEQLDEGRIGRRNFQRCADDDTAPDDARRCDEIEVPSRDGDEMTFDAWEITETARVDGWAPLRH